MNTNLILELILNYVTGYSFLNLSSSCKYLKQLIQSKAESESSDLIESYRLLFISITITRSFR